MTTVRVPTPSRGKRQVSTTADWVITMWVVIAWICALGTVGQLLARDWGDALDGASITLLIAFVIQRNKDVNALLGGHR